MSVLLQWSESLCMTDIVKCSKIADESWLTFATRSCPVILHNLNSWRIWWLRHVIFILLICPSSKSQGIPGIALSPSAWYSVHTDPDWNGLLQWFTSWVSINWTHLSLRSNRPSFWKIIDDVALSLISRTTTTSDSVECQLHGSFTTSTLNVRNVGRWTLFFKVIRGGCISQSSWYPLIVLRMSRGISICDPPYQSFRFYDLWRFYEAASDVIFLIVNRILHNTSL